jgi:probable rRNA maturation factor
VSGAAPPGGARAPATRPPRPRSAKAGAGPARRRPRLALTVLHDEGVDVPIEDAWFERLARATLAAHLDTAGGGRPGGPPPSHPVRLEATVLLSGDALLHRLNREYRGLDRPTDVLSFSQLEPAPRSGAEGGPESRPPDPAGGPVQLGDVAVSVERARRQAEAYGHTLERELGYLVVHGLAHLLGYDHEADAERQTMRAVEEATLADVGLTRDPA